MIRFLFLVLLSQPVLAQVTFTTLGDITFINDGEKSTTVQQLGNISFINQSLVNAIENVTFLGVAPTTDIDGGEVRLLFQSE